MNHAPASEAAPPPEPRCENCGEPLLGGHCYSCGQPTKGLVRHFSSILGDFADTVFNIDSRVFRTLPALLFKPGYLSAEYFAGRRVRYVSPVRLFVFLSIITLVLAQWATPDFNVDGEGGLNIGFDDGADNFNRFNTVAEVEAQRDQAVAGFERAIAEGADVPGLAEGMREVRNEVQAAAQRRIDEINGATAEDRPSATRDTPGISAADPPGIPDRPKPKTFDGRNELRFNGEPWHPTDNPLNWSWLPEVGNRQLNELVGRLQGNTERIKEDPSLFKASIFNSLPTTLFVLVPVFALLLKLFYLFKRRLYMEHLIVSLHSHAFLCLAVMLLIAMSSLEVWAGEPGWLTVPFGFVEVGLAIWMPLYLLLTQKRIYRQGWPMTLLKFVTLGTVHFFLLTAGVTLTMIAAAIWL